MCGILGVADAGIPYLHPANSSAEEVGSGGFQIQALPGVYGSGTTGLGWGRGKRD